METVCAPNTTHADRRRAHEFYWNLISLLQPFMWKTWRTRERSANLCCSAWAEKLELWRNLDWNGSWNWLICKVRRRPLTPSWLPPGFAWKHLTDRSVDNRPKHKFMHHNCWGTVWRSGWSTCWPLPTSAACAAKTTYNGGTYPYNKAQKLAKKVWKSSIIKFKILILSHLNILTQHSPPTRCLETVSMFL